MCQNDKLSKLVETYFYVDIEEGYQTAYFNINLEAINQILIRLSHFISKKEIIFEVGELLRIDTTQNCYSISRVIFKLIEDELSNDLIVNVDVVFRTLWIFCTNHGMSEFINNLLCLKISLEKGVPDDISCMVPEWGGKWLLNKQIIKDSYVICHLRLYGII